VVYKTLSSIEVWARRITGILFVLVGLYFTITLTAGISLREDQGSEIRGQKSQSRSSVVP
jgi:hypothetical protein